MVVNTIHNAAHLPFGLRAQAIFGELVRRRTTLDPANRGEGRRRVLGIAALCLFVGVSAARSAEVADVVELVEAKGWRADLGRLCAEFALPQPSAPCTFNQLSVQEIDGRSDPRGFNVPLRQNGSLPFILIFHLGPLVGEFFVATSDGILTKAFYRSKGRDYEELPIEDVQDEFQRDLQYWTANLSRLRTGLERR